MHLCLHVLFSSYKCVTLNFKVNCPLIKFKFKIIIYCAMSQTFYYILILKRVMSILKWTNDFKF